MKTILVPTDFSYAAENASLYAVNLAKEINAKVILFHAFHLPVPASEIPVMIFSEDEIQKDNEAQLKKDAEYLMSQANVKVTYIARMGFALEEILEEEENVDILVMGMKGASELGELLIGSTTTEILRKTKKPLMVIPEKAKFKRPEKIVFACDYNSKTDLHILDILKDFAKDFSAKILVLNIKGKDEATTAIEAAESFKIEQELENIEHLNYYPENEDPVDGINEFVEKNNAEVIAIIPHRYSLLERLFHKSISKKLAFHTHVPLLALPDDHKAVSAYLL